MVHVQLRPIFIGGPSVQLGQLHLIEKLNLYEALQMKRSGRKINTFKCNSTPIFWLSPAALAAFGASPWLLYLGCDDKLSQYRFSNWPFWLFCALPVSIQAHIVTILVKKWMHEVKCYFSFTLQMGLFPEYLLNLLSFLMLQQSLSCIHFTWLKCILVWFCSLFMVSVLLKAAVYVALKLGKVFYDWFVLYSPQFLCCCNLNVFSHLQRLERWLEWLWTWHGCWQAGLSISESVDQLRFT